ncbi:YbaB/EbfC family nucleoid-associated protein [Amycolatopsis acidicola]|uniref:YbaB/EbfC family nucleoid-associated protein n=2 Tax=Amycolatopsis acidicola TaxID=2596893 RepID=A0A5N0V7H2_9PSEU|nr:YbaB/EbfC family nucleoid-associated protein [Amycolatopsis acidicola]
MYADYQQMAEEVRTAQRHLAEIRATAESDDGLVSATVGSSGELTELQLDPRIYHTPDSARLSRAITETIRQAAEDAHRQAFTILARHLPADASPEQADLRFDPLLTALDREVEGGQPR